MPLQQPKKPVGGGYGVFMAAKRPEFTKQLAGQAMSAVSTLGSQTWKKLSAAEQAVYVKKYEAAKANYERDMAAFIQAGGQKEKSVMAARTERKKEKAGTLKRKDPDAPKRPGAGGYGCFLAKNRAAFMKECKKVSEVATLAGKKWKAMTEKQQAPFVKEFEEKQAAYRKAMETYKPPAGAAEESDEEEDEEVKKPPAKKAKVETPMKAAKAEKKVVKGKARLGA